MNRSRTQRTAEFACPTKPAWIHRLSNHMKVISSAYSMPCCTVCIQWLCQNHLRNLWHEVHRCGEDVYMFFPAATGKTKLKWWWRLKRFRASVGCLHRPFRAEICALKLWPLRNHISMNSGSSNMLFRNNILCVPSYNQNTQLCYKRKSHFRH